MSKQDLSEFRRYAGLETIRPSLAEAKAMYAEQDKPVVAEGAKIAEFPVETLSGFDYAVQARMEALPPSKRARYLNDCENVSEAIANALDVVEARYKALQGALMDLDMALEDDLANALESAVKLGVPYFIPWKPKDPVESKGYFTHLLEKGTKPSEARLKEAIPQASWVLKRAQNNVRNYEEDDVPHDDDPSLDAEGPWGAP